MDILTDIAKVRKPATMPRLDENNNIISFHIRLAMKMKVASPSTREAPIHVIRRHIPALAKRLPSLYIASPDFNPRGDSLE
ncbi:MAG: hypothetical protein DRN15_03970 [Thermoprotei archaeon]|nr:MAG: hypothetical protein DRM97_06090 [Thermoprotei archaeon]RLF24060.1 MAG: hypothetical protein DRN15_03970 [Thermoprotei archaeon]